MNCMLSNTVSVSVDNLTMNVPVIRVDSRFNIAYKDRKRKSPSGNSIGLNKLLSLMENLCVTLVKSVHLLNDFTEYLQRMFQDLVLFHLHFRVLHV